MEFFVRILFMNTVLPVYKTRALTCGQLITQFKTNFSIYTQEKISVAGRLDPMAEGLLLLLIGEANKQRHFYQSLEKQYLTQILFGVETDTYDVLGLITKIATPPPLAQLEQKLPKLTSTLKGTYHQAFPPFSSKTVGGKPLYYWTRKGVIFPTYPTKEITINQFKIKKFCLKKSGDIVKKIISDVSQITGDFRQESILHRWREVQKNLSSVFPLVTVEITCSSGTYIRSIADEIGKQIGCGAIAYTIKRTRIGNYTTKDAIKLDS